MGAVLAVLALLVSLAAAIASTVLLFGYEAVYAQTGNSQQARRVAVARLRRELSPAQKLGAGLSS